MVDICNVIFLNNKHESFCKSSYNELNKILLNWFKVNIYLNFNPKKIKINFIFKKKL